ncbi:MAG TPA: tail fiber domain-containing protein [Candidatus Baltobacteraceae bacterium]|nr:tail fiber domain-containing protein [Candidatus Baltobacteraceae bacterium]
MGFRVFACVVAGSLVTIALSGCGGDAAAATHAGGAGGAVPAVSKTLAPPSTGALRRTLDLPSCAGAGSSSFVGANNSNVAAGEWSVVVGGRTNRACDQDAAVLGGFDNAIDGGGSASDSIIGGGELNVIAEQASNAAILGGGSNVLDNAPFTFIGGGSNNQIAGLASQYSVIAGGAGNKVFAGYGFVGSGEYNQVTGEGGFIGAGGYDVASGEGAVVGGGYENVASANFAAVPGGYRDTATGTYSLAAGAFATAAQTGTFVWSDGSDGSTALRSSRAYQFLARAAGGFTLYTNAGATVGAELAAGSGTWASLSDRGAKTNIVPLDDASVLEKIASLPISRWSYRTERGVRHVGPMAQDFYAAFAVGEDDKHITSVDEDGVALAGIKALHARLGALESAHGALRSDELGLHARVAALGTENARLRSEVRQSASAQLREIGRLREEIRSLRAALVTRPRASTRSVE